MQQITNLAVIIRGHFRTWDFCKSVLLDKLNSLAPNVDFYFATWDIPSKNLTNLHKDFYQKNLKEIIVVPKSDDYMAYSGVAKLSYLAIHTNTFLQNKKQYQAIIDTRPDITPCYFNLNNFFGPNANTIHTEFCKNNMMSDLFLYSTIDTHEKFSNRYLDIKEYLKNTEENIHPALCNWLSDYGILGDDAVKSFWYSQIIRPDIYNYMMCADDVLNLNTIRHHLTLSTAWQTMTTDEKLNYIKQNKIEPEGYLAPGMIETNRIQ